MALRKQAEKEKSKLVPIIVSVVLLSIAGIIMAMTIFRSPGHGDHPQASQAYYWDLTSDKLFAAPDTQVPIVGPSGDRGPNSDGTGVKAYVFTCGSCANEADRFVAYLESIDIPKSTIKPAQGLQPDDVIVASPSAKDVWVSEPSPDGAKIVADGMNPSKCAGKPTKQCVPPEPD